MSKQTKYSKEFKIKAVKQYNEEGLTPKEIFKQSGLDLSKTTKKNPGHCLSRWNKTYKEKGEKGFSNSRKGQGGRPRILKFKNEKEKIKYLELQVKYLKAENDFLIKLRAQKRKE